MHTLFEPVKIGNFEIKNRFMRSATHYGLADENGFIHEANVSLMRSLALNHVGLIVTGYAFVQKNGQCFMDMNGIDRDEHIPGYKEMTRAVHEAGGKIVMQIAHGGINATAVAETGGDLVAVSVPDPLPAYGVSPRALTSEDIVSIIHAFGQAARRVEEAGFDGVQIHGAHGYLVTQFLSPSINHRKDEWGGPLDHRMKFVLEVVREMKRRVSRDFPIMIKLGCRDFMESPEKFTVEESIEVINALEKEGVCHVEISHSLMDKKHRKMMQGITSPNKEAYMLSDARAIRKKTSVLLGLVGGMRSPSVMENIIGSGVVDTLSICRPLIREPHLIRLWEEGSAKTADCISCGKCFQQEGEKRSIRCSQVGMKNT
jgi:2,4-dienoyl-CoA reductase-like NADH-dependent reductase (Old Yellow Enzyme family)